MTRKQIAETGMTVEKEKRVGAVTFMVLRPGNHLESDVRAMMRNTRTNPTRFYCMNLYKKDEAYRLFGTL